VRKGSPAAPLTDRLHQVIQRVRLKRLECVLFGRRHKHDSDIMLGFNFGNNI
jgi:hypothetical protein